MTRPAIVRMAVWTAIVAAGVVLLAFYGTQMVDAAKGDAKADDLIGVGTGYRLPAFKVADRAGQPHELSQYKGQVLVLHFWASWCPYCQKEIPKLTQLTKDFSEKGVRVLAVSSDQDPAALQAFLKEHALPYPIAMNMQGDRSVFEQYGVTGIPVTLVIARDGRIVERLNGSSDIVGTVERALK